MKGQNIVPVHTQGHSIWLIPASPEYDYLQRLIQQFSEKGATPPFPPHITLLGQLKQNPNWLKTQMLELYKDLDAFNLNFSHIGMFDTYFRSIVMHIHTNSVLAKLYARAKMHFKVETKDVYVPHLSLLYSNLEISQKKTLMEGVFIDSPFSVRIAGTVLVETNGAPDQWRQMLRIPFN